MFRYFFSIIMLLNLLSAADSKAAVTGTYELALIKVDFSDTNAEYSADALQEAAREMTQFFGWLSNGNLDLKISTRVVSVGQPIGNYLPCRARVPDTDDTCQLLFEDAVEAAASGTDPLDFSIIKGVLIVSAHNASIRSGSWANSRRTIERPNVRAELYTSYVDESAPESWSAGSISGVNWASWAHELGHQLTFFVGHGSDSAGHPTGYASGYDLLDSCYPCGSNAFSLADSSLTTETGAQSNLTLDGWLPADRIHTIDLPPGTGETVVLAPVSDDLSRTAAPHGLKISVSSGVYYFVDVRRRLRADAVPGFPPIYGEGVEILRINESASPLADQMLPCESTGTCLGDGAGSCGATPRHLRSAETHPDCWPHRIWQAGESFEDPPNNLRIKVEREVGNGFAITVTRGLPTSMPDVAMTPWLTPPRHTWETIDIWVDSSCNGYEQDGGELRYGRRADGTVMGNGDNPCINHPNRIYATVRNQGGAPAEDVQLTFKVSDPLGVGVTDQWTVVGTAGQDRFPELRSLASGATATVYVDWNPQADLSVQEIDAERFAFHTCIRVEARPVVGESIVTNLDGPNEQENISQFEIATEARTEKKKSKQLWLSNSGKETQLWRFDVNSKLPRGWHVRIANGQSAVTLKPGEVRKIDVELIRGDPVAPGSVWAVNVVPWTLVSRPGAKDVHAIVRHANGGVEFSGHGVRPSELKIDAKPLSGLVALKGILSPQVAHTWITIDYRTPRGDTVHRRVRTDKNGTFRDGSIKVEEGRWSIRALWQGNMKNASALSNTVALDLK